eukprot:TCONS_00072000-protein
MQQFQLPISANMHISNGETRILTGTVSENITMGTNSTLILRNCTLNGSINSDENITIKTEGRFFLNGPINVGGNLTIIGDITIGGGQGSSLFTPTVNVGGNLTIIGDLTMCGGQGSSLFTPTVDVGGNLTHGGDLTMCGGQGSSLFTPGDWLMTDGPKSSIYKHHFIYVGRGEFVSRQTNGVQLEKASVYQGKKCWLVNRGGQAAASKARARVGESGYNLVTNNCEHFCSEVSGLGHHSEQVFVSTGKACVTLGSALANHLGLGGSNVRFTSSVSGGLTSMGGFGGGISFSLKWG